MASWRRKLKRGHNVFLLIKTQRWNVKPFQIIPKALNKCSKDWCKQFYWNLHRVGGDASVLLPAGHEQGQRQTPDSGERPVD